MNTPRFDIDAIKALGDSHLPGLLGVIIFELQQGSARSRLQIRPELLAPNGYLHAGTVVTLADTTSGYGCLASLPEGANSFTTIELKSNHLDTALEGSLVCSATMVHGGRITQVWDASVKHEQTDKTIALFRCTQMILYSRQGGSL